VLCNGVEVSSGEPDLDGSGEQSRVNERMRFDGGECPFDGDVGTSSIALREQKLRGARLRLTAELLGLERSNLYRKMKSLGIVPKE
jgi:transcriptional regulator of acetoin/glycerol metabolism